MKKSQQTKDSSRLQRGIYLVFSVANLAVAGYLTILLSDLDTGRLVLGIISTLTAIYFAYKTIE